MKREKIACECRSVTYGMIEDAIRDGARSFEEVAGRTGCGKSCGRCREFIRHLTAELLREENK